MGMADVMLNRYFNYAYKFSGTIEVLIESLKGTVWDKDNYIGSAQQRKHGGLKETQFGMHNEDLKNRATDYIIELSHKLDDLKELARGETTKKQLLDAINHLEPYYFKLSKEEQRDWEWGTWETWSKDHRDKFFTRK